MELISSHGARPFVDPAELAALVVVIETSYPLVHMSRQTLSDFSSRLSGFRSPALWSSSDRNKCFQLRNFEILLIMPGTSSCYRESSRCFSTGSQLKRRRLTSLIAVLAWTSWRSSLHQLLCTVSLCPGWSFSILTSVFCRLPAIVAPSLMMHQGRKGGK